MESGQQIEIPLNKSRIVFMLVGSLALVAIGFWFVIDPPELKIHIGEILRSLQL